MRLYLLALNPTDSVTEGFLPAADRLGLSVTVLTDQPDAHREAYRRLAAPPEVLGCEVRDFREVVGTVSRHRTPDAVFSNSDHLQTQAALAADYFGLPAKDWRATLRAKNKAQLRRHLAAAGLDSVHALELAPGQLVSELDPSYPCVVKPREGVASEDVALVADADELAAHCAAVRRRRPQDALVVEEFLEGELHTLETLGDAARRHVLGGFRTQVSPPPHFVEEALEFVAEHPGPVVDQVLAHLDALGVGFGACHTEFVVQPDGRARIIEVNYRAIGDQCDLMLAKLLDVPYFELVLRVHLGEALPDDLGARTGTHGHNRPVLADRAGTLTAAPPAQEHEEDGVHLVYRPFRAVGEHHEHHRTNRDYLGVVWAVGADRRAVDGAVDRFLAANRWEITP